MISRIVASVKFSPFSIPPPGGILEFIFYPKLINPCKENKINDGRKRIDISFDNGAPNQGFFHRLQHAFNIPCPYIHVECKNYTDDPENPEVDQLAGRFSVNTGKFGILVCRKIENKNLFLKRCKDLWKQKTELIIPVTDEIIVNILSEIKNNKPHAEEEYLTNFQREVILQ